MLLSIKNCIYPSKRGKPVSSEILFSSILHGSQYTCLSDHSPAFFTSNCARIFGGDPLDLGAMSGFTVARVAGDHAVLV